MDVRVIILYSRHEAGSEEKAEAIVTALGPMATQVDVSDAFDGAHGEVLKAILMPREFPAVIPILDHLQGSRVVEIKYLLAAVGEQMDIEARECFKNAPGHLEARLAQAREEGREEIRSIARAAAAQNTIDGAAKTHLQNKGVL